MNAAKAYQRTQQETASKERLMSLLFEAALKHIRAGASAMEAAKTVSAREHLVKAGDIVAELSATLDVNQSPELGQTLKELYLFVSMRLIRAATEGVAGPAREAERVFAPVADAFTTAVAQTQGGSR